MEEEGSNVYERSTHQNKTYNTPKNYKEKRKKPTCLEFHRC